MRQERERRSDVPPGGDAPGFACGDVVTLVADACHRGKVVALGNSTVTVRWPDVDFPVVYAEHMIRRLYPWEK